MSPCPSWVCHACGHYKTGGTHRCERTFTSSLALSTESVRPTVSLYVNNACHLPQLGNPTALLRVMQLNHNVPSPWKGLSTCPGGLPSLHVTETRNLPYLQTPNFVRMFWAFSGGSVWVKRKDCWSFPEKHAERPWFPPNPGQQQCSLL